MRGKIAAGTVAAFVLCAGLLFSGLPGAGAQAGQQGSEAASSWTRIASRGIDGTYDVSPTSILCEHGGLLYAGLTWGRVMSYDGASWTQVNEEGFGDPDNIDISALASYDGALYAGTTNVASGAEVWRYDGGTTWTRVAEGGFGNPENANVNSMASYGGHLYAGTSNVPEGCEVWRYDGAAWEKQVEGGFTGPVNDVAASMAVFGGALFVGTCAESGNGCEAWRYDGANWAQSGEDGFGDWRNVSLNSLAEYGGFLYAGIARDSGGAGGGGGFSVYRFDGADWSEFRKDESAVGGANCMAVLGGYLYVDVYNSTSGCELRRSDGADEWSLAAPYGYGSFTNIDASSLLAWGGKLYAGTQRAPGMPGGCQIWSYDGASWRQEMGDGFGGDTNRAVSALAGTGRFLYAGTENATDGCEIWRMKEAVDYPYRRYFAEGSTGSDERGGFETWITVANPGDASASVSLTYLTPEGEVEGPSIELGAGRRWTVNVGDTVPDEWSVAAVVESTAPVVAERSTYWSAAGADEEDEQALYYRRSAHASLGAP